MYLSCVNTKLLIFTQMGQTTAYHFLRDYETVKIEQEVPNELLLVIDRGDTQPNASGSGEERVKGAYYKNIERKMTLKKRRTNVSDQRSLLFLKLIAFPAGHGGICGQVASGTHLARANE